MKKKRDKVFSFKYLFYDFVRVTAALPGLIWYRPKRVYVSEKAKHTLKGGALIICNHISLVDPMYIMLALPERRHHFIAWKLLFEGKFRALLFNGFLCIPVEKDRIGLNTFKRIVGLLQRGNVVDIFPEGHVNEGNELQEFKSGMIKIALKGEAPIIPVYLKKRKKFYSRLVIGIGEPVDVVKAYNESNSEDKLLEITSCLYEKERELQSLIEG